MDFSEYIGAMTAISMINDCDDDECYEDVNTEWVEDDRMTDKVKEVVYNPAGGYGKHNHTYSDFIMLSGKWEVE